MHEMVAGVGLAPTKRPPPKEVTRSLDLSRVEMVGREGFEPSVLCSRSIRFSQAKLPSDEIVTLGFAPICRAVKTDLPTVSLLILSPDVTGTISLTHR